MAAVGSRGRSADDTAVDWARRRAEAERAGDVADAVAEAGKAGRWWFGGSVIPLGFGLVGGVSLLLAGAAVVHDAFAAHHGVGDVAGAVALREDGAFADRA